MKQTIDSTTRLIEILGASGQIERVSGPSWLDTWGSWVAIFAAICALIWVAFFALEV